MKSFPEENRYVLRGMQVYLTVGHSTYFSFQSCGFGYVYSSLFYYENHHNNISDLLSVLAT